METPSSPIAEGSRAPPTQAPMPAMRIEHLKDLDAVSARHYVDAYWRTRALGSRLGRVLGFVLWVVAMFALHVDTTSGQLVLMAANVLLIGALVFRLVRRAQRGSAGVAAGISFPLELEVDVIVADLTKAKKRVGVDEVLALLLEKVRIGTETPRSVWLRHMRLRRALNTLAGVIIVTSVGAGFSRLQETERVPSTDDRSAPARVARLRPYWQKMTTEQQHELAVLWVARAARLHLADACARMSMVDVVRKLRSLPQPITKDDAATIHAALADVAQQALDVNDTPIGTAAFGIMGALDRVMKNDFNEDDLSSVSFATLMAARSCGAGPEEEAWQRRDVGAPDIAPIKNR